MRTFLLVGISALLVTSSASSQFHSSPNEFTIKRGETVSNWTGIQVFQTGTTNLVYEITVEDLYSLHYHQSEFHKGSLYVILRTGGADGYRKYPQTWTDALWRFDENKRGTMIFSARGLDFRASPSANRVAIHKSDSLLILDAHGKRLCEFAAPDFQIDAIAMGCSTNEFLYFANGEASATLDVIVKLSLSDFRWSRYDVTSLGFDTDYSFNPNIEKVVVSDCPFHYDAESYDDWLKSNPQVTLYLYDLRSRVKSIIATATGKGFGPRWIDSTHIEFNDPASNGRITRQISR
jgi:hypothetical protein